MKPDTLNSPAAAPAGAPSERSFGLLFAAVFFLIALFPLTGAEPVRRWALALTAVFALAALAAPRTLRHLNRVWFRLGLLLHRIVNPVVLGVIYFGVVVPLGLVMRRFRKDSLNLARDPACASYWIKRTPPGPAPESLKHPF